MNYKDLLREIDTGVSQSQDQSGGYQMSGGLLTKEDRLEQRTKEKQARLGAQEANTLTGAQLQQELSDAVNKQVYTRSDGSQFQYDFQSTNADGTYKDTSKEIEYTGDGSKYKTRDLYIDDTLQGNMKLGLARSDQEGYKGRYDKNIHPSWGLADNQELAGSRGVTPEDGALLNVTLPYGAATKFEQLVHTNKGQIENRAAGQTWDEIDAVRPQYGSGVSEYTTPNAPIWNIDSQQSTEPLPADTYMPGRLGLDTTDPEIAKYLVSNESRAADSSRAMNVVKAAGVMASTYALNAAAFVANIGSEDMGNTVFGTAKERREGVEEYFGYDASHSKEQMDMIEKIALENMSQEIVEEEKGWFDKYIEEEGSEGIQAFNRLISNLDGDEAMQIIQKSIETPETAVEFYGVILGEVLVGKGAGLLTKAGRAQRKLGKMRKVDNLDPKKIEAFEKVQGLTNFNKAALKVAQNSPLVAIATGMSVEQEEEFFEKYDRRWTNTEMAGSVLLNTVNYKLEKFTDVQLAKGLPVLQSAISKGIAQLPKSMQAAAAKSMILQLTGRVAQVAGGAVVVEPMQEGIQGLMEELNKYNLIGEDSQDLTKEEQGDIAKNVATGMLAAPGSAVVMQAPSAAKYGLGATLVAAGKQVDKSIAKNKATKDAKIEAADLKSREEGLQDVELGQAFETPTEETIVENEDGTKSSKQLFKSAQEIQSESKDKAEYQVKLEQNKQDVIGSIFNLNEVDKGQLSREGEALKKSDSKAFEARMEQVESWMGEYASAFTDKDGVVKSATVQRELDTVESAIQSVRDQDLLARQEAYEEIEREDRTKAETDIVKEFAEKQEPLKDMSVEERTESIFVQLQAAEGLVDDKVEAKEISPERIKDLRHIAKKSAEHMETLGMSGSARDVFSPDPSILKARAKSEKSTDKKSTNVDKLSVASSSVKKFMDNSIEGAKELISSVNYLSNDTQLEHRVIKKLTEGEDSKVFNKTAKAISKVLANPSEEMAHKLNRVFSEAGIDQGQAYVLASTMLGTINSAVNADTGQRRTVALEDPGMKKEEYLASKTNAVMQGGKDYYTSQGLTSKGKPAAVAAEYMKAGDLGLHILKEAGLVEETDSMMYTLLSDRVIAAGGNGMKRLGQDGRGLSFKGKRTTKSTDDSSARLLMEDKGLKIVDTESMFDVNNPQRKEVFSYSSDIGDIFSRFNRLLLPSNVELPRISNDANIVEIASVVVDNRVVPYRGTVELIEEASDVPAAITGEAVEILTKIKTIRDTKFKGNLDKMLMQEEHAWVKGYLGVEEYDTKAALLSENERGVTTSRMRDLNGILDNLDTLTGDLFYDYQIDVNQRITARQVIMNYQGNSSLVRQIMGSAKEYSINVYEKDGQTITPIMDETLNDLLDNLGIAKTPEDYKVMKEQILSGTLEGDNLIGRLRRIYADYSGEKLPQALHFLMGPKGTNPEIKKFKGQIPKLLKLMSALDTLGKVESNKVNTHFLVESDASASGVFNVLSDIVGRNPVEGKKMLRQLGVQVKGSGPITADELTDAYNMLRIAADGVLSKATKSIQENSSDEGELNTLLKELDELGIDARDLAKYPVMTWFYSAGASSITDDLVKKLTEAVVRKAVLGDRKALDHLGRIIKKDNIEITDVVKIEPGSPEHLLIIKEYSELGNMYTSSLDKAFPGVSAYKEDMARIFKETVDHANVNGKDYFRGIVKSATRAYHESNEDKNKYGLEGTTSLYKMNQQQLDMSSEELVNADLLDSNDDGKGFRATSVALPNITSIMALLAQNRDFGQLSIGMQAILDKMGMDVETFLMVHDAYYTTAEQALIAATAIHESIPEMARKGDFTEMLIWGMSRAIHEMEQDLSNFKEGTEERRSLEIGIKDLAEARNKEKAQNDIYIAEKVKILKGSTTKLFGVRDIEKIKTGSEASVESTQEQEAEKPVKKETPKETKKKEPSKEESALAQFKKDKNVMNFLANMDSSIQEDVEAQDITFHFGAEGRPETPYEDTKTFMQGNVVYMGSKAEAGVNELKNTQHTAETLLDLIGHEVEHIATIDYLTSKEGKNSKEYKLLEKLLSNVDKWQVTPSSRLGMIMNEPSTDRQIKELVAVYNGEASERVRLIKDLENAAGTSVSSRIVKSIESLIRNIHAMIGRGNVDFNELSTDSVVASLETISRDARVHKALSSTSTKANNVILSKEDIKNINKRCK